MGTKNFFLRALADWIEETPQTAPTLTTQTTLINNHVQDEREIFARQGKISGFFSWKLLKNCILNEKFKPYMTTIRAFLPKIRALFPIFEKGQGRPPPHPSSSDAPGTALRAHTVLIDELLRLISM